MASYTKVKLSGSTDGLGILITGTATAGTLIHTADASALDEVFLWVVNTSTLPVKLTTEWGEATTKGNIEVTIPGEAGLYLLVPGLLLTNSKEVRAFAGTASVLSIMGFVNRITP